MVGKHDVLVATARENGEAAHVVAEELSDGPDLDVKFIGLGVGKWAFDDVDRWKGGGWIGLNFFLVLVGSMLAFGGADALSGLYRISFDGFGA